MTLLDGQSPVPAEVAMGCARVPERYDLTAAATAAMPGLEYLHDAGTGQLWQDQLSAEHPYFPGQPYTIKNFYGDRRTPGFHGDGAWSVEVTDNEGARLMRSSFHSMAVAHGSLNVGLVRPAKGAILLAVEDPLLAAQTASVLAEFGPAFVAEKARYDAFVAAQRAERSGLRRAVGMFLNR